ncbi:MAG: glycoside hydrolase family 16 protein [Alistipes sp.]|nr:glycoside hydrolase family 16 protein [Alistipes sp.]
MNKSQIAIFCIWLTLLFPAMVVAANKPTKSNSRKEWKLIWKEEFKGKKLDTKSWSRYTQNGGSDWDRHMSGLDSLCRVENGVLQLWGINTPKGYNDNRPFLTGGVGSKGLRSVKNGRIEVRARYDCGEGFWPAIWLMPDINIRHPYGGEIDIMEHLNYDDIAFQTAHTPHTLFKHEPSIQNYVMVPIDKAQFNTYAVEVNNSEITFYINGKKTFSYKKMEPKIEGQYPFNDFAYYIILSAQLGGSWVGNVNPKDLPVKMEIDYVKFYERR